MTRIRNTQEMTGKHRKDAITRLIALLKKVDKDTRPELTYARLYPDNVQMVNDQYRMFRLASTLPTLPVLPKELWYSDEAQKTFDKVDHMLTTCINREQIAIENLPDVTTLRNHIKKVKSTPEFKAKEKKDQVVTWDFGYNLPAVNAQYLVDTLLIYPDAVMYVLPNRNAIYQPIYIDSAYGDGVLLPILADYKRNNDTKRQDQILAIQRGEDLADTAQEPAQEPAQIAQEPLSEAQAEPQHLPPTSKLRPKLTPTSNNTIRLTPKHHTKHRCPKRTWRLNQHNSLPNHKPTHRKLEQPPKKPTKP